MITGKRPELVKFAAISAVVVNWISTFFIFILTAEVIVMKREYMLSVSYTFHCFTIGLLLSFYVPHLLFGQSLTFHAFLRELIYSVLRLRLYSPCQLFVPSCQVNISLLDCAPKLTSELLSYSNY
jgi:hypothetical protein